MTLIYGADADVACWVADLIFDDPFAFGDKYTAIGVTDKGRLIAGVVYNNYHPEHMIEMSVASIDKKWANRHNLRAFFKYPFIDLGVKRVQTLCSAAEGDVVSFNQRLGFKKEGFHREAWPMGGDAVSFGMLKNECKWIK